MPLTPFLECLTFLFCQTPILLTRPSSHICSDDSLFHSSLAPWTHFHSTYAYCIMVFCRLFQWMDCDLIISKNNILFVFVSLAPVTQEMFSKHVCEVNKWILESMKVLKMIVVSYILQYNLRKQNSVIWTMPGVWWFGIRVEMK